MERVNKLAWKSSAIVFLPCEMAKVNEEQSFNLSPIRYSSVTAGVNDAGFV